MLSANLQINNVSGTLEFKNTLAAKKIFEQLPFSGLVQVFDGAAVFDAPFSEELSGSSILDKGSMQVGDLALWKEGGAMVLKVSHAQEFPHEVEIVASLTGDTRKLIQIKEGELIFILPE